MSILTSIEAARREADPARLIAAIPYAETLGIGAALEGEVLVARMPFRDDLIGNPLLPALHGGTVGSLLELTASLVLLWRMESVSVPRCVTLSVDYLRSAGPRDCYARGQVMRLGRRVANLRVEAWQEDPARPIAQAHAHLLITPPEPK